MPDKKSNLAKGRNSFDADVGGTLRLFVFYHTAAFHLTNQFIEVKAIH